MRDSIPNRNPLAAQTRRTTDALKALEQTAARLSSSLNSGAFRVAQTFGSPERMNGLPAAQKMLEHRMPDEAAGTRGVISLSPPNGERAGVRGQLERSNAEEAFSTELLKRLADEFTTRTSSPNNDNLTPAPPISSLERMGFVFNNGGSRADDYSRNTAENTRKTVLLLERIEKKNPAGTAENTFNHIA